MPRVTMQECTQCPVYRLCSAHNPSGEWEHDEGVDPCVVVVEDD